MLREKNFRKIPQSKEARKVAKQVPLVQKKEELDLQNMEDRLEWIRRFRPEALTHCR